MLTLWERLHEEFLQKLQKPDTFPQKMHKKNTTFFEELLSFYYFLLKKLLKNEPIIFVLEISMLRLMIVIAKDRSMRRHEVSREQCYYFMMKQKSVSHK